MSSQSQRRNSPAFRKRIEDIRYQERLNAFQEGRKPLYPKEKHWWDPLVDIKERKQVPWEDKDDEVELYEKEEKDREVKREQEKKEEEKAEVYKDFEMQYRREKAATQNEPDVKARNILVYVPRKYGDKEAALYISGVEKLSNLKSRLKEHAGTFVVDRHGDHETGPSCVAFTGDQCNADATGGRCATLSKYFGFRASCGMTPAYLAGVEKLLNEYAKNFGGENATVIPQRLPVRAILLDAASANEWVVNAHMEIHGVYWYGPDIIDVIVTQFQNDELSYSDMLSAIYAVALCKTGEQAEFVMAFLLALGLLRNKRVPLHVRIQFLNENLIAVAELEKKQSIARLKMRNGSFSWLAVLLPLLMFSGSASAHGNVYLAISKVLAGEPQIINRENYHITHVPTLPKPQEPYTGDPTINTSPVVPVYEFPQNRTTEVYKMPDGTNITAASQGFWPQRIDMMSNIIPLTHAIAKLQSTKTQLWDQLPASMKQAYGGSVRDVGSSMLEINAKGRQKFDLQAQQLCDPSSIGTNHCSIIVLRYHTVLVIKELSYLRHELSKLSGTAHALARDAYLMYGLERLLYLASLDPNIPALLLLRRVLDGSAGDKVIKELVQEIQTTPGFSTLPEDIQNIFKIVEKDTNGWRGKFITVQTEERVNEFATDVLQHVVHEFEKTKEGEAIISDIATAFGATGTSAGVMFTKLAMESYPRGGSPSTNAFLQIMVDPAQKQKALESFYLGVLRYLSQMGSVEVLTAENTAQLVEKAITETIRHLDVPAPFHPDVTQFVKGKMNRIAVDLSDTSYIWSFAAMKEAMDTAAVGYLLHWIGPYLSPMLQHAFYAGSWIANVIYVCLGTAGGGLLYVLRRIFVSRIPGHRLPVYHGFDPKNRESPLVIGVVFRGQSKMTPFGKTARKGFTNTLNQKPINIEIFRSYGANGKVWFVPTPLRKEEGEQDNLDGTNMLYDHNTPIDINALAIVIHKKNDDAEDEPVFNE